MYFRNILNQIYNLKKKITQYLSLKKPRFNNRKFGFLHIGKTSGVSLLEFFTKLNNQKNKHVPTWFSHEWKLRDIIKYHPNIKISLINVEDVPFVYGKYIISTPTSLNSSS